MSQAQSTPAAAQATFAELFQSIRQPLAEVESRLRVELKHDDPFINELAQHVLRVGGKRLRPALLLLSAQAVGEIADVHLTLATVAEMVHTATLVHDDVLDEAVIRRHRDTVNARWNNLTSVLLGDYIFSHAFYLASCLDSTFACQTVGRATNIVCEGELKQTASSGNFRLTHDEYFEIVHEKTAELCACCCLLGAHFAGADEPTIRQLESYGRKLGVAFQIADDLLDLEGEEQTTGKSLGTDLAKRKMTLPLLHLRDQLEGDDLARLQQMIEHPEADHRPVILDWLDRAGSLDYTRTQAEHYGQAAAACLATLPESPAKEVLQRLTQDVVRRRD